MLDRGITEEQILSAIQRPDRLHSSTKTTRRSIAKKLYRLDSGMHLLMVIFEVDHNETTIVTVIDTSKIDKYY